MISFFLTFFGAVIVLASMIRVVLWMFIESYTMSESVQVCCASFAFLGMVMIFVGQGAIKR